MSLVCLLTTASNVLSGKGVQGSHLCVPALGRCLGLEVGLSSFPLRGQWRSTHSTAILSGALLFFYPVGTTTFYSHRRGARFRGLKSKGKCSEDPHLGRDGTQETAQPPGLDTWECLEKVFSLVPSCLPGILAVSWP